MSETDTGPRRAFVLELKMEADTRRDLVHALQSFATEIYMDKISRGVSGGYSTGSVYELSVDESITHETWAIALEAYLDRLDKRKAETALTT